MTIGERLLILFAMIAVPLTFIVAVHGFGWRSGKKVPLVNSWLMDYHGGHGKTFHGR